MNRILQGVALATCMLASAAGDACAQSAAEDAARIEELLRLERVARGQASAPTAAGTASGPSSEVPADTPRAAAPPAASLATPRPAPIASAPPGPGTSVPPGQSRPTADEFPVYENPDAVAEDPGVIEVGALDRHIGESVRVRSHGGRTRVGTIESVGEQGVTLRTPMGGGFARYTLPYSQITRIEKR